VTAASVAISRGAGRVSRRLDRLSERRFAFLVSVPGLLLLAAIVLPPTLAVFGLSLYRIELGKDERIFFNGLNNYVVRLPADHEILDAIPRTVILAALTTLVTLPLALGTALVLNRGVRGTGLLFMAVLLPWAVAAAVTGIFWRYIFDTHFGIVNGVLVGLGLTTDPVNWLQNTTQAVAIAIVAQAWRGAPLLAILILAALRTIPATLYRAARMDGATTWQAFRFITLPAIRPTLIVVGILQVIIGLQVFDLLFTLTNGGPGRQTYVLIYAIYDLAFGTLSLGYASTITVVLFAMIVICSLLLLAFQVRRGRRGSATTIVADEPDLTAQPILVRLRRAPLRAAGPDVGADLIDAAPAESRFESPTAGDRRGGSRLPPFVGRGALAIVVAVMFLFFVAPIAWMAIASIQSDEALSHLPPHLSLNVWLDGYARILADAKWRGSLVVSLLTSVGTTFFVLVLAAPASYALARFQLPGKRAVLGVLVALQMVPAIVMAIPVLKVFQFLHLTDTVAALVIVNVAFWLPLITWLLRNFFSEVPIALERAARIDGCSRLGTLFRVTIPAARPGIAAAAILILIGTWNEFLFAVILGNHNAVTITRQITSIEALPALSSQESLPPNLLAAGAMVAVIPCLVLVLLFHRRVITGLTEGLVKG
jgi:ABC-type sugar transport system permease subunit